MVYGYISILDRKSTRLNSSHSQISYAVFCLKKKQARGASEPPPRPRPSRADARGTPLDVVPRAVGLSRGQPPPRPLSPFPVFFFFNDPGAPEIPPFPPPGPFPN